MLIRYMRVSLADPDTTIKEVAETFRVSRATIYRSLGPGSFFCSRHLQNTVRDTAMSATG
jgi:predicted DNA-binding transcriptional regulator AlpA